MPAGAAASFRSSAFLQGQGAAGQSRGAARSGEPSVSTHVSLPEEGAAALARGREAEGAAVPAPRRHVAHATLSR